MTEKTREKQNIPETEAEIRAEQMSDEFRVGRVMRRILAAGVLVLALLLGLAVYQVIKLHVI